MTGLEPTSLRSQLPQLERWRKVKVNALLILVTMIWGSTFLIVQQTIRLTGPFTFLAMRFSIGALVLAVIFRKRLAQITCASRLRKITARTRAPMLKRMATKEIGRAHV